jgi:hypothetical protein
MCGNVQGFCVLRPALGLCPALSGFPLPVVLVLRPSFEVGLRTWLGDWVYYSKFFFFFFDSINVRLGVQNPM